MTSSTKTALTLVWPLLVGVVTPSCSTSNIETPLPTLADSGFELRTHAFPFENFAGGYDGAFLTNDTVARMFGAKNVCTTAAGACVLTADAQVWADETNLGMDAGRCEGFAVLSSLMFLGVVKPTAFGASRTRTLDLDNNVGLQRELAYWYATQSTAPVTLGSKKLDAKGALRFLATVLKPGANEFYRMGFARKTPTGFAGGHAVTPYKFESKGGGRYALYLYDNNFPDEERVMTIDTNANSWSYQASSDPKGSPELYTGNTANGNHLYFAPVVAREGVLPCPFCPGAATSQTTVKGALQVVSQDGSGNRAGLDANGQLAEAGGASASPGFSRVNTYAAITPLQIVMPRAGTPITHTLTGTASSDEVPSSIVQIGPGFTAAASNLKLPPGKQDTLSVAADGANVSYKPTSGTPVTLATTVTRPGGGTLAVTVIAPTGATNVAVNVNPTSGQVAVVADGTTGQPVSVAAKVTDAAGETKSGSITTVGAQSGSIMVDTNAWPSGNPAPSHARQRRWEPSSCDRRHLYERHQGQRRV